MATFAKPENALKRAEELINVGQKQAALQALHDIITSKRYRAWQKTLEKIMFKYVELCVDMRKGRFAKDGLIQYRIICLQVNVSSLEEVIKLFMNLATERAEEAKSQAQALEDALDVDDLEADQRPEDLMLSFVSGERGKERSDRELVTPWFKFLWETYRTVLEILRNNSKLESLYAMTAYRAFQFCRQYKRTTEFRRLCEIIRNHLMNLNKYRDQRDRPDLTAPESLQLYLDTRVEQLKIATELGLWQEAFRSVEDIHGLMTLVKKTPKPSVLVIYYAKLTEIFWGSESHLYHAYAWLKLFNLQKAYNKNLSQKDLQLIASSVLLAAISVVPYDRKSGASHLELETEKERNFRMANLLNFALDIKHEAREMLSRSALLSELAAKGVISCISPEVKDLYYLLEHDFQPLDLASKVQPLLAKISKIGGKLSSAPSVPELQLSQYIPALEKLTTLRVLQQASQVFRSLKLKTLSKMVPFFDLRVVEKISVDSVKCNFITMKVDHVNGAVIFDNTDIESDGLCNHLSVLADSLRNVMNLINQPAETLQKRGSFMSLPEVIEKEHRRLLARKSIIEKRKEDHERQMMEKEKEEEEKKKKQQKITEEAEKERLAAEFSQREQLRIRREIEARELQEAQAMLIDATKFSKRKVKKPFPDGEKMTKQVIMEMALTERQKERHEMEKKLQKLAKIMDYLERAKREEEASLILQAHQHRLEQEKVLHEQEQLREIELSRERHEGDLQEKNRLSRMLEQKKALQDRIVQRREAEFNHLRAEMEERINRLISERKHEREINRKLLYFLDFKEKELVRLRQEEEARKCEEEERKKREEAERKARLDAIAEKQRQRELELEEKERLRREAVLRGVDPITPRGAEPVTSPAVPAPAPAPAVPVAAALDAPATTGPGKYVPRHKRVTVAAETRTAPPPSEPDKWSQGARSSRPDERPPPRGDSWQNAERRPGTTRLPPSSSNAWSSRSRS